MTGKIIQEIKMMFQGKVETFQIMYECATYKFCECKSNPAARGFFTTSYFILNKH